MTLTAAVHSYLTSAHASDFCGQPVTMLAHWQGSEHLLWRVECHGHEAVVKLYMDAGQVRSRRQFDGQQMGARLGIAPTPHWSDREPEGVPRPLLVYDRLDGAQPALGMREQRLALAQVAAQVHTADPDELRRFSPRPVNLDYFWRVLAGGFGPLQAWLHELGALATARLHAELADGGARLVERALPHWSGVLPAPIHGDLLAENVVVAGGVPVLLDWELFGLGDPALEVARFLQDLRAQVTPEEAEDWLESYLLAADLPSLAARIAAYRRLLPFQQLSFLLDGLRQLTPAERATAEFQASTVAIEETIRRAFTGACAGLDVACTLDEPTLDWGVQADFVHDWSIIVAH